MSDGLAPAVRFDLFRRANVTITAVACVGLPFTAFTRLVLFHFYTRGAFLLDSGLLASLMWHSDAALTQPASLGGGSFFATHVTPLFLLAAALSRVLPFSLPQFFAGFVGFSHALLALAVFWLLVAGFGMRRGAAPWLAALAALGFAGGGLAIAIARYPHFETLIAACFLLFATALTLGHRRLAAVCFLLGLATREDAGLHYAAVLGLLVALNAANGMPLGRQRADLGFALAGLLYAVTAMLVQRLAFPGGSAFVRIYLGDPPLAHLTASFVGYRLLYFMANRPYVWLPGFGAAIWAILARNPGVLLGYAACVPWLLLQLSANSPLAGALASYYAFPFLIALAWPLFAVLRQRQGRAGGAAGPLAGFAVLLALSCVPGPDMHDPGHLPIPGAFLAPPSSAQQAATDRAVAALSAARDQLGRLWVDNSVAAIDPGGFTQSEVPFRAPEPTEPADQPDTVAFFADGYDAARLRAAADAAGLNRRYRVPGTSIRLAARQKLEDIPMLAGLVAAE